MSKPMLTAIIIARNEEERIGTCIRALSFCDRVLVADNGSSDDTIAVSKRHGAVVVPFSGLDFASLRMQAAKKIESDWVVYVDADEVIDRTLASSIRDAVDSWIDGKPESYRLQRKNKYFGYPFPGIERMHRLFKKTSLVGWYGKLHESPKTKGKIGDLPGYILHDTHRSLEEMIAKTNEWSDMEADLRLAANHPKVSWWRFIRVAVTGFFDSYVRKEGWKAGTYGLIEGMYQGFSMFITYAKLWEKQEKKRK